MAELVTHISILTTVLSLPFAAIVFARYLEKRRGGNEHRLHLLWWAIGIALFGVGTFAEGSPPCSAGTNRIFRSWYITGALLGGAPPSRALSTCWCRAVGRTRWPS